MAGRKTHDLAVKVGEYTNKQGETKAQWLNVGRVVQYDDGSEVWYINRTFNPAGVPIQEGKGGDAVPIRKFEPRNNDQGGGVAPTQSRSVAGASPTPNSQHNKAPGIGGLEDDIAF